MEAYVAHSLKDGSPQGGVQAVVGFPTFEALGSLSGAIERL